jgi:hypothetical protein
VPRPRAPERGSLSRAERRSTPRHCRERPVRVSAQFRARGQPHAVRPHVDASGRHHPLLRGRALRMKNRSPELLEIRMNGASYHGLARDAGCPIEAPGILCRAFLRSSHRSRRGALGAGGLAEWPPGHRLPPRSTTRNREYWNRCVTCSCQRQERRSRKTPLAHKDQRGHHLRNGAYRDRTGDPLLAKPKLPADQRWPSPISAERGPRPTGRCQPAPVGCVTGTVTAPGDPTRDLCSGRRRRAGSLNWFD